MNRVIFSSFGGKITDNRGLDPDKYVAAESLELPLEYGGHKLRALMAMEGLVIADVKVNIVEMTHEYVKEVYKISCGDCSVGYSGTKILLDTLGRFISGEGTEEDIKLLERVGIGISKNTRCDFCGLAVKPVLDSVQYFRSEYTKLIGNNARADKSAYLTRVTSPCMEACPAHQDIPGYIELTENRRYIEALRLIRKTNCFPGAIGRACVAFCEANCVRNEVDEPLSIRALKRFPADFEIAASIEPKFRKRKGKAPKVVVIGAGPAGLAASYNLALMGYQVTVYDEQSLPGGMALAGIPAYRLPKDVLGREVDIIKRLGIEFKQNSRLGKDLTLTQLFKQGYKAVFIATGAGLSRASDIEGWREGIAGAIDGIEFLHDINVGRNTSVGNRVLIVGGGNVAVDCARTCLRLGSKDVRIIYRRSRDEMPGRKEEIEAAELEGAKMDFLTSPVKLLVEGKQLAGVKCLKMRLAEPDASGRRRPVPVEGSEFIISTDMIISAIGETPDLSFFEGIGRTEQDAIKVDPITLQTSLEGVYAGGDCTAGPATLIEAVAAGNRAARSIDRYLRSGKAGVSMQDILEDWSHKIALNRRRNGGILAKRARQSPEQVVMPDRTRNFNEVERSFTAETAVNEASRCLRCYRVMLLVVK